jgi:glutamate-ammonia-ligase adenylyltransferase
MAKLLHKEKPAKGFWDMKLEDGGLVDLEFAAQFLQITGAAQGCALIRHTSEALKASESRADPLALADLATAWTLQQDLSQVLKVAIPDAADPSTEPAGFRSLLARTGGARNFTSLTAKLRTVRAAARKAFDVVVK